MKLYGCMKSVQTVLNAYAERYTIGISKTKRNHNQQKKFKNLMLLRVSRACAQSSGNKIQYYPKDVYIYTCHLIMEIKSYRNVQQLKFKGDSHEYTL